MDYKLRGQSYEISNSSDTLLSKIESAFRNELSEPEDDAKVAYVVSKACLSIPSDICYYADKLNFAMCLDSIEIASFMLTLQITVLERAKLKEQGDKIAVQRKIKEMKAALDKLQGGLSSDQVRVLVGQIAVDDTAFDDDEEEEEEDTSFFELAPARIARPLKSKR